MTATLRHQFFLYLASALLMASAVTLVALQAKPEGWFVLIAGALSLLGTTQSVRKHFILVFASLGILGLIPIDTNIGVGHILGMGAALMAAVGLPLLITRKVYGENIIRFPWTHGRKWYKREIAYILITAVIAYLILPFYFQNTGAYLNWPNATSAWDISKLFVGTNGLGIWDELFFVATCLALLRRHLPFNVANIVQATLFTSFLYELGFTGWAPFLIYPFALIQGYIFKKTESLLYIITIHLTLDFILFLALLHAHNPTWIPIFITG